MFSVHQAKTHVHQYHVFSATTFLVTFYLVCLSSFPSYPRIFTPPERIFVSKVSNIPPHCTLLMHCVPTEESSFAFILQIFLLFCLLEMSFHRVQLKAESSVYRPKGMRFWIFNQNLPPEIEQTRRHRKASSCQILVKSERKPLRRVVANRHHALNRRGRGRRVWLSSQLRHPMMTETHQDPTVQELNQINNNQINTKRPQTDWRPMLNGGKSSLDLPWSKNALKITSQETKNVFRPLCR